MAAAMGKSGDRHHDDGGAEIMSIGELGRRVGTKVNTIRFYEEIGLLPTAERSASGRRRFTQLHLQRLRFIRNARSLGFSTTEIRSLLSLADQPEKECAEAMDIASAHLATVNERIARLSALREELGGIIARCDGGRVSDCRVIEAITDLTDQPR